MEGNFTHNVRSPGTKDTKKIDWMQVRRVSGKTALSAIHTDINSDSESE